MNAYRPYCNDSRKCFAKSLSGHCGILTSTYLNDEECPFCKEERNVTDGYRYFKNGGKVPIEKP